MKLQQLSDDIGFRTGIKRAFQLFLAGSLIGHGPERGAQIGPARIAAGPWSRASLSTLAVLPRLSIGSPKQSQRAQQQQSKSHAVQLNTPGPGLGRPDV